MYGVLRDTSRETYLCHALDGLVANPNYSVDAAHGSWPTEGFGEGPKESFWSYYALGEEPHYLDAHGGFSRRNRYGTVIPSSRYSKPHVPRTCWRQLEP